VSAGFLTKTHNATVHKGAALDFWERVKWGIRRQYFQFRKVVLRARIGNFWQERGEFLERRYPDYHTYLDHQKTKFGAFRAKSIMRHDSRFHAALSERLAATGLDFRGTSVLCLAARQGSEVRAFIDQGAFAIGIDLNPGPNNRYVLVGDFHRLQFGNGSVDWVYTNSLDHAFDIDAVLQEVRRVLAPGGCIIVEAGAGGSNEAEAGGRYEAIAWSSIDALLKRICADGFELAARRRFDVPWVGEQLVLRVV
jgi:SAM-dependent methyltransferase